MKWKRLLYACLLAAVPALLGCGNTPAPSAPPAPTPVILEPSATASAENEQTPFVPGEHTAEAVFINVGKADAALLSLDGKHYLIDTGTEDSVPSLFAALNILGITKLDGVFLTHTHSDHIGGMTALGRYYSVERLYAAVHSENRKNGKNKITELSEELDLPLTRLSAGETVPVGNGLFLEVLGPLVLNTEDDNDNSLLLRLNVNGHTLLFTGDMQFAEEQTLLDAGIALSAQLLKVGNHGNPDATGDEFAARVSPSVAVISTDTAVDTDSANPRVIAALQNARVLLTQDYERGILFRIPAPGNPLVPEPLPVQQPTLTLTVVSVDRESQTAVIQNDGEGEADVSGCVLLSKKGGESFRFPEGSILPAGGRAVVSGQGGAGDYAFIGEDKPWNKKKADPAYLYDRFGNLLSKLD